VTTLLQNLPQGTIVSTQNMLLDALGELNDDVVKLQQTLTIISIPIISLVLVITLLSRISNTNKQVYQHGLLICRGFSKGVIKVSFLIEGIIVGFFAVIGGILTSFMFISALYFVIPSDKDYFQWLYVFFNNGPSIVINSLFLGFILGFGLNYIVYRNISKFKPIETIYQTQSEMTYWFHKPQKDVNLILLIIVSIIIIWILQQSTHLNEILGRYRNLLLLFDDFVSILRLILPILIVLLLTRIVTNRREILSRYMLLFAFFLNSTIKNIIHLNSLRRPKHLSTLAFITAIAFSMGITPIILSYSAYDVSIRQLKREVGSDIRITGSYSQLEDFVPSSFYNLSSHIKAVTSLVWVDGLIVMENRTSGLNELNIGVNYLRTGLLAIEPDNYVEVAYFEDCFISDNNPKELFTKLSSDVATAVAPVSFKNFEIYPNEYIQYNIGSVLPIQFDFTDNERIFVNFSVVGFFYLIPGFIQQNFNPPLPLICSREYLESLNITHRLYLSWEEPLMSWLIKIDPSANSAIRRSVFKNLNEYFHDFEVVFIDNVVRSFLVTPTGSVVVVMDAIFFVVLILTLFGLSLVFLQTFNERTTEIAIYRSRGMRMREIRQMFLFEILSIDVLGVIFGVIIGLVTSLTYIDILITPNPRIPVNLLFPEVKLVTFIGLQILIHIILILGQSFWSGKQNILRNLRVID
ncbi:MAG: FtsX-like permease family protein, partial [Candidatus Hodarchaeota archaeon]